MAHRSCKYLILIIGLEAMSVTGIRCKENCCPLAEELLLTMSLWALQSRKERFHQHVKIKLIQWPGRLRDFSESRYR